MPSQPQVHDTKDAQDVDRLLRSLMLREESARPASHPRPGRPVPPRPSADSLPTTAGVWAWAVMGAVLAGALTQWPYATCSVPLAMYLLGVALVMVAGGWAALMAWRVRMGVAHVLAVMTLFAGAALAAHAVLSRTGYTAVAAVWRCTG